MTQLTLSLSEDDYYDLGKLHRPVTTKSQSAQVWFDRGLVWCYGFNHEAGAYCFEQAIKYDPHCAMAHWGLAYALGPNYNKPWEVFDKEELAKTLLRTYNEAAKANQLAGAATPVERALCYAIQFRYQKSETSEGRENWNKEYANAMQSVYQDFSDDLDVATLYADSLMTLTPWKLWDLVTGIPPPGARTLEAKAVLDHGLSSTTGLEHPGLLHLYIHLMEMSPTPEVAMPVGDRLRNLVPDSGHLQHMPTHIDVLCGDYRRAIASNSDAIVADEKFVVQAGKKNFYTLYRVHNCHFKIYAAMFAAQLRPAMNAVEKIEKTITEDLLRVRSPPMADWLEAFLTMRLHVMIRFGLWEEIIGTKTPEDQDLYRVTTAMTYYAKGVALAALGRTDEAQKARELFLDSRQCVPASRTLFNNICLDIFAIAEAMLDGELQYRLGNYELTFTHLRHAIHLADSLPYEEPWGWMQPVRHAYGALLLEQGHLEEATKIYSADLGFDSTLPRALQHPNNVWALYGLHECLVRLGRTAEAEILEPQLKLALAVADVKIGSSCYCSRNKRALKEKNESDVPLMENM